MTEPLCKDCKFYRRKLLDILTFTHQFAYCGHPKVNLQLGGRVPCQIERNALYRAITACGYDGKLFQPKK
jgi:hypothetical protein